MKIKTAVFLSVIATLLLVSYVAANDQANAKDEKQTVGEYKIAEDGYGGGGYGGGGYGGGGYGGGGGGYGGGRGGGWGGPGGGWGGGGGGWGRRCYYGCCGWYYGGGCRCCYNAREALAYMQSQTNHVAQP